jgi:hypothetical protein
VVHGQNGSLPVCVGGEGLVLFLLRLLARLQPNDNPISMHSHLWRTTTILNMSHALARFAHLALDRNPLDQVSGSLGMLQPSLQETAHERRDAEEESVALVEDPEDFGAGCAVCAGEGWLGENDEVGILLLRFGQGSEGLFFVPPWFLVPRAAVGGGTAAGLLRRVWLVTGM